MPYTNKTDYTKQQIIDSLVNKMKATDFDEITVNDIVNPVHLNRSTFYRYFDDKYQVLQLIEDQLLTAITNHGGQGPRPIKDDNDQILAEATAFFQANQPILTVLLSSHGLPSFEERLKSKLALRFQHSVLNQSTMNSELTILSDMLITIIVHALKTWVLTPNQLSLEQTLILLRSVVDHGIFETVQKYR